MRFRLRHPDPLVLVDLTVRLPYLPGIRARLTFPRWHVVSRTFSFTQLWDRRRFKPGTQVADIHGGPWIPVDEMLPGGRHQYRDSKVFDGRYFPSVPALSLEDFNTVERAVREDR